MIMNTTLRLRAQPLYLNERISEFGLPWPMPTFGPMKNFDGFVAYLLEATGLISELLFMSSYEKIISVKTFIEYQSTSYIFVLWEMI